MKALKDWIVLNDLYEEVAVFAYEDHHHAEAYALKMKHQGLGVHYVRRRVIPMDSVPTLVLGILAEVELLRADIARVDEGVEDLVVRLAGLVEVIEGLDG